MSSGQSISIKATPLGRLWWLNPSWVFGLGTVGTFFLALCMSDKAYDLYETPKYLKFEHVWIALSAWLALEVGRRIGGAWQRERGDSGEGIIEEVNWWFFATFGLTVAACGLLLVRGMQNGLSLAVIKENLFAPPQDVSKELVGEVIVYLPGVTTATQFGIICALLGVWLNHHGRKYVRKYIAIVVGLAAMRALLFHERLALIEVVVAAAVLVLRLSWLARPLGPSVKLLFRVGPVIALLGMVLMFGTFEYFRSWKHYRHQFDSIAEFTVWRLGGYYSTSMNNGALGWDREGQRPLPFATINAVWEFPLVEKSPFSYEALTGTSPPRDHEAMLKQYGNYEYNSLGGLFEPLRDWGLPLSLVWWLVFGAVLGWAYRGYLEGSLLGLLLLPIAIVSLLEMPRFVYLTHPRALASLLVIAWLGWRLLVNARRAAASKQARPEPELALARSSFSQVGG